MRPSFFIRESPPGVKRLCIPETLIGKLPALPADFRGISGWSLDRIRESPAAYQGGYWAVGDVGWESAFAGSGKASFSLFFNAEFWIADISRRLNEISLRLAHGLRFRLKEKSPVFRNVDPELVVLRVRRPKHDHETNYCDHNFADVPETDGNQAVNKKD